MVRSMFAAVAGLKAHQSKMDVISNNIANANTTGYKSQSATFKDSIYSSLTKPSGASAVAGGTGGLNASQLGYGSVLGAVRTNFTPSYPSYTGYNSDVYCDGPGFFMVGPFEQNASPYNSYLSRSGQFTVKNGYLMDSMGNYVYGATATAHNADGTATAITGMTKANGSWDFDNATTDLEPIKIGEKSKGGKTFTEYSIDGNGKITATDSEGKNYEMGYIALINVNNPGGMIKKDGYYFEMGASDNSGAAGTASIIRAGKTAGSLMSGYLEGSNVDIAQEFSEMITTQRGFQANTKIITVTDEMLEQLVNMKR